MKHLANTKHQIKRVTSKAHQIKRVLEKRASISRHYTFSIDSPRQKMIAQKELEVEGWVISKDEKKFKLRIRNNDKIFSPKTGLKRLDVAKAHPEFKYEEALYSGFRAKFDFEDGEVVVEINNGNGFKKLYSTFVIYGAEALPAAIYNKNLSNNYPEHVNLIENRQKYYYEDGGEGLYVRDSLDPRLMAIYLPQFHPFKENDEAWGRGFTEWSNVTTGQPRFIGHQQPILPKDLGFYDLRLESKLMEQIELAKKYGIYGFCFYYYWFSGKKLMETPINTFLSHPEWDFKMAICWANENWTKRWDGRDSEIIIEQKYREDDPMEFILDVEPILTDPRYVQDDGKPILMVYRASELKNPSQYAKVWRDYFRKKHNKELQLVSFLSFDDQDPREYGFDAALDFAPLSAFFKSHLFKSSKFPYVDVRSKLIDISFSGVVADYRSIALNEKLHNVYDFPTYQCLTPSWDNDARKKGKGFIYQNSSPDLYADWLNRLLAQETKTKKSPLLFINAWNEWAEGALMEPSMHLGHAVLNRTVETLSLYSNNKKNSETFPLHGIKKNTHTKLAVVVHLYYTDLWPKIRTHLERINVPFDLFVSLNVRDRDFLPELTNADCIYTQVLPNRGRDVLPFLYFLRRIRGAGYEYVLKLHGKKSTHRKDGTDWLESVLANLIPNSKAIEEITVKLSDKRTGLIGPHNHLVSLKRHMGANREVLRHLIRSIYKDSTANMVIANSDKYPYFGGTMFWARLDVLEPILNLHLMPDDFHSEHGQIDGTTAHALERLFGVVALLEKKAQYMSSGQGLARVLHESYTDKYRFAP